MMKQNTQNTHINFNWKPRNAPRGESQRNRNDFIYLFFATHNCDASASEHWWSDGRAGLQLTTAICPSSPDPELRLHCRSWPGKRNKKTNKKTKWEVRTSLFENCFYLIYLFLSFYFTFFVFIFFSPRFFLSETRNSFVYVPFQDRRTNPYEETHSPDRYPAAGSVPCLRDDMSRKRGRDAAAFSRSGLV